MLKICRDCHAEKPDSELVFPEHIFGDGSGFLSQPICLTCKEGRRVRREATKARQEAAEQKRNSPEEREKRNIIQREKNKNPETRAKKNKYQITNRFGLLSEQYDGFINRQQGRCAICDVLTPLAVDHDHVTGKIRGMLCRPCNVALGMLKDSPDILERARDYILSQGIL